MPGGLPPLATAGVDGVPPPMSPATAQSLISPAPSMMSIPLSPPAPPTLATKDLTFLLRPANFHPLPSTTHIPAPFLSTPSAAPPTDAAPAALLQQLRFRAAAIAAAAELTAASSPADNAAILELWYIRLLALCLAHQPAQAAQEIKVFQDLTSTFYLDPDTGRSVIPWEMRVLAVGLALASDPRRAVARYYALAAECRAAALDATVAPGDRAVWRARLGELGVRVANALLALGDLAAAVRHLSGLRTLPRRREALALLYIRAGMIDQARACAGGGDGGDGGGDGGDGVDTMMDGLLLMAEGQWAEAVDVWRAMVTRGGDCNGEMAANNLAVCQLYLGRLSDVCPPHPPCAGGVGLVLTGAGARDAGKSGGERRCFRGPDLQPGYRLRALRRGVFADTQDAASREGCAARRKGVYQPGVQDVMLPIQFSYSVLRLDQSSVELQ